MLSCAESSVVCISGRTPLYDVLNQIRMHGPNGVVVGWTNAKLYEWSRM